MDPWREIEERAAADAAGKPVDVHTRPGQGVAFVYTLHEGVSRDALLDAVLERLRRIRDASSKRVRERRFNVWYGTAPDDGGKLAVLMLPDRFDYHAWQKLADLNDLPGYRHQGGFQVAEIEGSPLVRYDHGTITGYLGPTTAAPTDAGDVEWKSAIVEIPARRVERKWMVPPSGRATQWHTGENWQRNRERMLKFVWQLRATGTYPRLAEVTEKHFGIAVREELEPDDVRYGLLRLGFLRVSDFAVPVGVFLRRDLSDDLKYLVLAHELSHYIFHFPLLYLGALVDDIARGVPEAATVFEAAVATNIDRDALERQADYFTSNFLIPARYDVDRLAARYMEMGRQPSAAELAWRFLQPLIPGGIDAVLTWTNLEQMSALTAADLEALDDSPATLYARILKATVERIEGLEHDPGDRIANGFDALQETFDEITEAVTSLSYAEAREALGARTAEAGDRTTEVESVPDDMRPGRYELLAAVAVPTGQRARSIHLVPAAGNPAGERGGPWIDRHQPELPPETIAGWRDLVYEDVALRLYRHEAWQPDAART